MNKWLYERLLTKPYPVHQFMDEGSIKWLNEHLQLSLSLEDVRNRLKGMPKFPLKELDINIDYYNDSNYLSIHGIRHQLRVCLYIWMIINYYKINIAKDDIIQLLQASLYHDIKRKNDNTDLEHGKNSAIWIKGKYDFIRFEIIEAIASHDLQMDSYNLYSVLIKTADALDRYRLPKEKWWLKKDYLLMNIDDDFIEICKFVTFFIENNLYTIVNIEEIVGEYKICLKKIGII